MMINEVLDSNRVIVPSTRIAKVEPGNIVRLLIKPESEPRFCLLGNLFTCRGEPGKVHLKQRHRRRYRRAGGCNTPPETKLAFPPPLGEIRVY